MNLKLLFLSLLVSCIAGFSQNQDSFLTELPNNLKNITVEKQFVYTSKSDNKNIEAFILNPDLLTLTTKTFVNTGAFNNYNWIRIDLKNTSNQTDFIFEFNQTYIDSIQMFIVKDKHLTKTYATKGLHFNDSHLDYFSNKYAYTFPFQLAQNETISIYFNAILHDGSFRVVNKIWSTSSYKDRIKDVRYRTSYLLFFGGFTCLVLLISIALFFFSYKKIYLYYTGFVFVIFLNLIALRHFINPSYIEKYLFLGNNFAEMLALLQVFFMLKYFNHFFLLKSKYPKIYQLLNNIAKFTIVIFFLSLYFRKFDWFYSFVFYLTKAEMILIAIIIYAVAIFLALRKEILAYYFMVAYLPLMFVILHYILTAMKITNSYNPLQWEFVIFVEIFTLSIAMAHNYYLLMEENRAYQEKIHLQRLKISRDLHDNIGSQLTFIISSIDNLKFVLKPANELVTTKLTNISTFASDTISQLRDTIWAMNKNEISFEDFQTRILSFIEKAKLAKESIKFHFNASVTSNPTFSSINGMNLFRVLQEAVNNAVKYSNAQHIHIEFSESMTHLMISISDDGIGFDIQSIDLGNGLENIQKRMEEINGTFSLETQPTNGTTIRISIPKNT